MTDVAGLRESRDHLLRSLEDLERERAAGDIEEADYAVLKDDYTARAAQVLRALEPGAEPVAGDVAARGRPTGSGAARAGPRRGRPVLAVVVLVGFAAGAGAVVARSAGERLPGDPASGSIEATGPSSAIARDLSRAQQLIGEGKTLEAIKLYDGVLERDARQPEALAYRGWLLRLAGRASGNQELVDKGMEFIEQAVAADPSYPDAHFFKGFVLYQDRNDPAAAVPELRAFLAGNPPRGMVPVVEDLLRRALADLAAAAAAAAKDGTTQSPAPGPAPAPAP